VHVKAITQHRYGPPDVLELEELDRPLAGKDEVLVRVHAAGVDPAGWPGALNCKYL
jgi:NADPH:quinone reductase-like Zn-dependent oxidoreductase